MSYVSLRNPTGRNTQAYVVTVGSNVYYFSYNTCIAFTGYTKAKPEHVSVRLKNHWGPTTGQHFNELGCGGFEVVAALDPDDRVPPF